MKIEQFQISHISSFDIVHMWWTLWIILDGKCGCLKFLQFHTGENSIPHTLSQNYISNGINFNFSSWFLKFTESVRKVLKMKLHVFDDTCFLISLFFFQNLFTYQSFLCKVVSFYVWICSLGWNCIWLGWFHNLNPPGSVQFLSWPQRPTPDSAWPAKFCTLPLAAPPPTLDCICQSFKTFLVAFLSFQIFWPFLQPF